MLIAFIQCEYPIKEKAEQVPARVLPWTTRPTELLARLINLRILRLRGLRNDYLKKPFNLFDLSFPFNRLAHFCSSTGCADRIKHSKSKPFNCSLYRRTSLYDTYYIRQKTVLSTFFMLSSVPRRPDRLHRFIQPAWS